MNITASAGASGGTSVALVVALVSLGISCAVAGWNVLKYVLDGGRVKVTLDRGYLNWDGLLVTHRFGRTPGSDYPQIPDGPFEELGVIRIENKGRIAVSVSQPSFDLGARWNWQRMRIDRWTASPRLIRFPDVSTQSVERVEPFAFVTYFLDANSVLSADPSPFRHGRNRVLRASIRVAGKSWSRRSRWRHRWRLSSAAKALTEPVSAGQATYRALKIWELVDPDPAADLFLVQRRAANEVQAAWDAGDKLNFDRVRQALGAGTAVFTKTNVTSATITVIDALKRHDLIDADGKPRLSQRSPS